MWIKICGIRDGDTARRVAELRPDAIGLNFYRQSVRYVEPSVAADIVKQLPGDVEPVAVFVNHTLDEVAAICQQCGIRTIQLHGDETAEFVVQLAASLPQARVIRACRLGEQGFGPLREFLETCARAAIHPRAVLIDAHVDATYGGTGCVPPWDVVNSDYNRDDWPPIVLAGGLSPDSVNEAIRTVRPWGVDVASGVERKAGEKDLAAVKRFIEQARMAFSEIESNE